MQGIITIDATNQKHMMQDKKIDLQRIITTTRHNTIDAMNC